MFHYCLHKFDLLIKKLGDIVSALITLINFGWTIYLIVKNLTVYKLYQWIPIAAPSTGEVLKWLVDSHSDLAKPVSPFKKIEAAPLVGALYSIPNSAPKDLVFPFIFWSVTEVDDNFASTS